MTLKSLRPAEVVRGPDLQLDLSGPLHVSMGLWTILFGVSGNWDDREVTSLAEEFPKEPDSEKDTYERKRCFKKGGISFNRLCAHAGSGPVTAHPQNT